MYILFNRVRQQRGYYMNMMGLLIKETISLLDTQAGGLLNWYRWSSVGSMVHSLQLGWRHSKERRSNRSAIRSSEATRSVLIVVVSPCSYVASVLQKSTRLSRRSFRERTLIITCWEPCQPLVSCQWGAWAWRWERDAAAQSVGVTCCVRSCRRCSKPLMNGWARRYCCDEATSWARSGYPAQSCCGKVNASLAMTSTTPGCYGFRRQTAN